GLECLLRGLVVGRSGRQARLHAGRLLPVAVSLAVRRRDGADTGAMHAARSMRTITRRRRDRGAMVVAIAADARLGHGQRGGRAERKRGARSEDRPSQLEQDSLLNRAVVKHEDPLVRSNNAEAGGSNQRPSSDWPSRQAQELI